MSLKYKNENYAAIVVKITALVPLDGCDKVQAAIIMGQQVVVGLDVVLGDIGLYFPVETALSKEYLKENNLYKKAELNKNPLFKGYFEENGRIKCVKFRGHKSEGLYMPLNSVNTLTKQLDLSRDLNIGDCFDELKGVNICSKYVIKTNKTQGIPGTGKKGQGKLARESKLIENQFRFHDDTSMLYKNLHKLHPDDLISITYKMHGTSGISSKILCKKPLKWYEKLLIKLGINIISTQYDYLYSSRRVIKNLDLNPNAVHFYDTDIWGKAHELVKEFLSDGMTFYYEIVGFLPSGGYIQGPFDYGQDEGKFEIRIYRITYTNPSGKVFEFSAHQVQDFCKEKGLLAVPELYYGSVFDFMFRYAELSVQDPENMEDFLSVLKELYNEKDCYICKNKVVEEGVVIRIEKNNFEAYKCKSFGFYEMESKNLDKNIIDIESEN